MAKTGSREIVLDARSLDGKRWELALACGHKVTVTSTEQPKAATCRACPTQSRTQERD